MVEYQEKTYKITGTNDACKVLSAELENFLTESRNAQTVYSNIEGCNSRIIFQFHQKKLIEEFLTEAVFFKRSSAMPSFLNTDEENIAKNITEKIYTESQKHNCEVHFGVIWVNYFIYEEKKDKWLPVFKIYEGKSSNKALYVDAFLKVYKTWDYFIDNADFGKSLLCVPRNGEYHFDGNVLKLEYVLAKNLRQKPSCNSAPNFWGNIMPFSQYIVKIWIKEIQFWLFNYQNVLEEIKEIMNMNQENNMKYLNLAITVLIVCLDVNFDLESKYHYFLQAIKVIHMLLNFITFDDYSTLNALKAVIQNVWKIYQTQETKELLGLLKKFPINWIEVIDQTYLIVKKNMNKHEQKKQQKIYK